MTDERDTSDLRLYGAEDFEELDAIEAAIERALDGEDSITRPTERNA